MRRAFAAEKLLLADAPWNEAWRPAGTASSIALGRLSSCLILQPVGTLPSTVRVISPPPDCPDFAGRSSPLQSYFAYAVRWDREVLGRAWKCRPDNGLSGTALYL